MLLAGSKVLAIFLSIFSVGDKETKEIQSTAFSFMEIARKLKRSFPLISSLPEYGHMIAST